MTMLPAGISRLNDEGIVKKYLHMRTIIFIAKEMKIPYFEVRPTHAKESDQPILPLPSLSELR